jgi:hypothetical protein
MLHGVHSRMEHQCCHALLPCTAAMQLHHGSVYLTALTAFACREIWTPLPSSQEHQSASESEMGMRACVQRMGIHTAYRMAGAANMQSTDKGTMFIHPPCSFIRHGDGCVCMVCMAHGVATLQHVHACMPQTCVSCHGM